MALPDKCIRGIPNDTYLEDGLLVSYNLFPFDKTRCRQDGWVPESINWMDNENVIGFTLSQKKENGEEQFKAGVAILFRDELDKLKRRTGITEILDYERSPLPTNDYHGNILLRNGISSTLKTMVRSALALASEVHLCPKKQT